MRSYLLALALPIGLAACGSPPPPPTQVVVAPPPPVSKDALAQQCQSLFAQSMNGQAVSYSYPTVTTTGNLTTVRIGARTAEGASVHYDCSYSGSSLIASNPS